MFPCSLFDKKKGGNLIGIIGDSIAGIKGVKRAGISADCEPGNNIAAPADDGGWITNKSKKAGIKI